MPTHFPINHPLRPLFRTLGGLVGLYSLTLGVVGLLRSGDAGVFQRQDLPRTFGLPVNPAFAVVSAVVGALVLAAALIGRDVDRGVNIAAGAAYIVAGLVLLTVLQTDVNVFGFTVGSCVVSFVLGLLALTAGLYGKVGPPSG